MGDLCTSCLCAGRNLYLINETGLYDIFLQILNEIPVDDMANLRVRICFECRAELRRYQMFKKRTIQCYMELTMFLLQNSSESKLSLAKPSRLQIHHTTDYPQIEIKRELDVDIDGSHATDQLDVTIDDVKSEKSDTETHREPETFVKDLKVRKSRQKRKETVKKKERKITKEKKSKKPITKKKKKAKVKNRTLSASSNNSFNTSDVCKTSELESTPDEKVKDEVERGEMAVVDKREMEEFTCDDCGRRFEVKSELESHISNEHCDKRMPKNGVVVKKRKTVRVSEELGEKPECVECGKVFSSRKTYRYHLNVLHEGHNRHPCPRCGKVYQWKSNLGRHMRSHKAKDSGELHCDVCDKRFASIATYRQHLRVSRRHVSESEFTFMCNECGKKFVNKTRLRDHIDWEHLKKIKFRCQLCHKPFKCHTSLYVHMQNVHRDKEKKDNLCHVCGKSYQNAAKLKYHIVAMHTSETPYQCEQCSAAFGWYSSLYRHVREVHYKMKLQPKKAKKPKKSSEVLPPMMQHQILPPVEPGYLDKTLAPA